MHEAVRDRRRVDALRISRAVACPLSVVLILLYSDVLLPITSQTEWAAALSGWSFDVPGSVRHALSTRPNHVPKSVFQERDPSAPQAAWPGSCTVGATWKLAHRAFQYLLPQRQKVGWTPPPKGYL